MPDLVETMAYAGATPWHGKGTAVSPGAPTETMRQLAGLTWEPLVLPLTYTYQNEARAMTDRVMVRDDTGAVLSTVGPSYVPIQNQQIVEFFREYAEAGDLTLETLGALDAGRYVWALARIGAGFTLADGDRVEGYVLLYNPHLYGKGATALITTVRVVCWNTAQLALTAGMNRVRIWHTREFTLARRQQVQQQMGIARERMRVAQQEAELLVATRLGPDPARELLTELLGDPQAAWERQPRPVHAIWGLYQGKGRGATLGSARETAWGLLQAVVEHVDWHHGRDQDRRLRQAWLPGGTGTRLKRMTSTRLLSYAQGRSHE